MFTGKIHLPGLQAEIYLHPTTLSYLNMVCPRAEPVCEHVVNPKVALQVLTDSSLSANYIKAISGTVDEHSLKFNSTLFKVYITQRVSNNHTI